MLAELAALAVACAPDIHPVTLHAVVKHESRVQQYAIGVNRKGHQLKRQPRSLEERWLSSYLSRVSVFRPPA